ncbi:acyl-CoA thioesterase [Helicobacter didelphidarum]|uniref:Acyl-CoA thioesterase n=1 Tax=Helicobacter didelphidarum TaxID=2040648 RepID=A0A3D8IE65_9HELI|nr:thioesterase family protein [Helicobacter didelphidarum]RDU63459.1 acyl-CoA thioesterase [Helicobacter didelphidarum]
MVNYVFYDDTDCGGIVYHSNYITFCERARSLIFFENNMHPHRNTEGFVVKSIESEFITPLKFADKYKVRTILLELKHTSIVMQQQIFKIGSVTGQDKDSILTFSAKIKLAYIDLTLKKPCKIPENMRELLSKFFIES